MNNIKKFVTFLSPGTFCSETNEIEVSSWDVNKALAESRNIIQRHNAKPYGFYFTEVELNPSNWKKREIKRSGIYFLGGKLLTLGQIEARNNPNDSILISNMKMNGYDIVVENSNSFKITLPFRDGDTLVNYR